MCGVIAGQSRFLGSKFTTFSHDTKSRWSDSSEKGECADLGEGQSAVRTELARDVPETHLIIACCEGLNVAEGARRAGQVRLAAQQSYRGGKDLGRDMAISWSRALHE